MVGGGRDPGEPRSGHLDLDRLDLGALDELGDAVDLDVVGDETPRASERAGAWLEEHGVLPFVRRHRFATSLTAAAAVVVVAAGTWAWVHRSVPLAPAHLVVLASGEGPQLAENPLGEAAQVQQDVQLTVAEPPGTGIEVLGLIGPGLGPVAGLPVLVADLDRGDQPLPARGALACGTTDQTAALARAQDTDYHAVVRRSRDGVTAVDELPLVGAAQLRELVDQVCVQRAAERELAITRMTLHPADGAAALDVAIQVASSGTGTWHGLALSPLGAPALVAQGTAADLGPSGSVTVRGLLWVADCADPGGTLADAITFSASPGAPDTTGEAPPVSLATPPGTRDSVAARARELCGRARVTATVEQAILRKGGTDASGGTLDLTVRFSSPAATWLELPSTETPAGALVPAEHVLGLPSGTATTHLSWRVAPCAALIDTGLPRVKAVLTADPGGAGRRPYLVPLGGDVLGPVLSRLCPGIAPEIRIDD